MSDTSLYFNFMKGRDTVSPHTRKVSNSFLAMAGNIRVSSIISVAAMATLVAGIGGLIAHAIALTAALGPMLNLLALLPGVVLAAVAGFGALAISFGGIGAAMQRTASGGGGAARSLAASERRVAQAQREAKRAQDAINEARKTAAERLSDINRELRRAHLDEKSAILAVAEAEREMSRARREGDPIDIARADLAYEQAKLDLEDVRDRLEEVTEEEKKRSKAGVEGSEEVREAIERHQQALDNLRQAQEALNAGGGGGGVNKAAEAYAKLSQAGKELVDVLLALKPQWQALQRTVQQATFANVGRDIRLLAGTWLPMLTTRLAGIGEAWNTAFRGVAQLAMSKDFLTDIDESLGNIVTFLRRLGQSWAPVLSGLRHFTVVGSTFLPGIGAWILRISQRFEMWAARARATGKMHDWIAKGLVVLGQFWQILKNLGGAIGAIFSAGNPEGYLQSWVEGTAALRYWLESEEGQRKVAGALATLRNVASMLVDVIAKLSVALLTVLADGSSVKDMFAVMGTVAGFLAEHLDLLAVALPYLAGLFLVMKTVQTAHMATQVAAIPISIMNAVVMWRFTNALKAHTREMRINRATMAMTTVASKGMAVATTAAGTATKGASVGTRMLGFAMKALPIIGWISLIIELVMWIVHLWQTNEKFRTIVIGIWNFIWQWLKRIGAWFAGPFANFFVRGFKGSVALFMAFKNRIVTGFNNIVAFIKSIPGKIAKGARGMWDSLVNGFKAAINALIRMWNNFDLVIGGGTIFGVQIPRIDLMPNIPYLDTGGSVLSTGLAVIHRGEEITRAAEVTRRTSGERSGGSFRPIAVRDSGPVIRALCEAISREVQRQGGKPGTLGIMET